MTPEQEFSVTVELSEAQMKAAITEYLSTRGYTASPSRVRISASMGDRPGDVSSYSASVSGCLAVKK